MGVWVGDVVEWGYENDVVVLGFGGDGGLRVREPEYRGQAVGHSLEPTFAGGGHGRVAVVAGGSV